MAMDNKKRKSVGIRRTSYVGTIVVDIALIWAFGRLLEWGWPDFLTSEFADLVPWIRFSLVVGIAIALARFVKDPPWFVSLTECVSAIVTVIVAAQILQVFPFDFTGKASSWESITRVILIVTIIAAVISTIVNLVWAIVYARRESQADTSPATPSPAS